MEKEKVTRWFVEPRDARTNASAMLDLAQVSGATEEMIYYGKLDNEGEEHDVVEVKHPFVMRMEHNASEYELRFRVFVQREGESRMRLWLFGRQKKIANTQEAKRIRQQLDEMHHHPSVKR